MRTVRVLLAAFVVGCTTGTGVEDGVEVGTSADTYFVGAPIVVRLVNHTDRAIYVAHCNHRVSLLLQRRAAGEWQHHLQVNGPLCIAIYPSGETRIDADEEVVETFTIDESGEFRVLLYVRRAHEDFGALVVTSRPFTIRYPPDG